MHAANFREVRSLYLAVHLLNRAGLPTVLIRMGNDNSDYPYGYKDWAAKHTLSPRLRPKIANASPKSSTLADILVQPGGPDPFNDLRFPSKLPEFFAMAKPIILPRTNIGLVTRHLTDAYVVDKADGPGICVRRPTYRRRTPPSNPNSPTGALTFCQPTFLLANNPPSTLESSLQRGPHVPPGSSTAFPRVSRSPTSKLACQYRQSRRGGLSTLDRRKAVQFFETAFSLISTGLPTLISQQ